jgi:Carboxypeptidase regulatory-like domain
MIMFTRKPRIKVRQQDSCQQPWDLMKGDLRARHCTHCDKMVHNFAAMSSAEIKALAAQHGGSLCARVVRESDGSLVTADPAVPPARAAGFVLAASLSMAAAAQAPPLAPGGTAPAHLSGTVLDPDGSGPASNAKVVVRAGASQVAEATADKTGRFELSVAPGTYDLDVYRNIFARTVVPSVQLHAGEQSMTGIHLQLTERASQQWVTVGVVVAVEHYPVRYLFTHPVRYFRSLLHRA